MIDKRGMMLARLFGERAEWAVNGGEEVLLALPRALVAGVSAVRIADAVCLVEFDDGTRIPVPVPLHVAPFLAKSATILVVTLKGTGIVTETDVFVHRGLPAGALEQHA